MIWITGDTHGEFQRIRYPKGFSWLRNNEGKPTVNDYLIICGDFGGIWYDDEREIEQISRLLDNQPFKILYVTGNHENYDAYKKIPITEWNGGKIQKITDNVYRLMNGQVFNIDGYKVFTMGGARSHDIDDGILEPNTPDFEDLCYEYNRCGCLYRVNHISWWKEEIPSQEEFDEGIKNLEANDWNVDFVITHCAPTFIEKKICKGFNGRGAYKANKLTDYLEDISKKLHCKKWYFGHYHYREDIGPIFSVMFEEIEALKLSEFTGPIGDEYINVK